MSDEPKKPQEEFDINREIYHEEQLEEGKGHIKFGLGVGAFGAGSLAILGATCPLCFFVAPAMVGLGAWKSYCAKKALGDGCSDHPELA